MIKLVIPDNEATRILQFLKEALERKKKERDELRFVLDEINKQLYEKEYPNLSEESKLYNK